jgi:putative glutathione S-transferase
MATENKQNTTWVKDIKDGEFVRKAASFRNKITADGSSGFKAEPNRYHLYVSYACPWAHRTLIVRNLKGLEDVITVDVVDHFLGTDGWRFNDQVPGATQDRVNNFHFLSELYKQSEPQYDGRFTVPVLYDKQNKKIVNNESSEIIVMLNKEFNEFAKHPELDLYPEELQQKIEEVNGWIYDGINNGVYKCGFATTQAAYEKNFVALFEAMDRVEAILAKSRYLTGDKLTLADIRLWTTLVRFDPVYYGHFKTNKKRLIDYPNLWRFTRELYQMPDVKRTVNMDHIKKHYYGSHKSINPTGVVPAGPEIDFDAPIQQS